MFDRHCPDCSTNLPAGYKKCPVCDHPAAINPGTILTGKYELAEVLGAGAFGIAYLATVTTAHNTLQFGAQVVVKEMLLDPNPANAANNITNRQRFHLEADNLAKLRINGIPEGYGRFEEDAVDFMVMQYIEGKDYEKVLKAAGGKLSEEETLLVGIRAALIFQAMHDQGIIHRDIKPANLQRKEADGSIWVLDFGIARDAATLASRKTIAMTIEYASPEHFRQGGLDPDNRADIYSLAASLFHLCTGQPFAGGFPQRLNEVSALPATWVTIFRKAITIDREQSQPTMLHFAHDLNGLLPTTSQLTLPAIPATQTRVRVGQPATVAPAAANPVPPNAPTPTVNPTTRMRTMAVTPSPASPTTRVRIGQPLATPAPLLPALSPTWMQRVGPKFAGIYNAGRWAWNAFAPTLGASPLPPVTAPVVAANPAAVPASPSIPPAAPAASGAPSRIWGLLASLLWPVMVIGTLLLCVYEYFWLEWRWWWIALTAIAGAAATTLLDSYLRTRAAGTATSNTTTPGTSNTTQPTLKQKVKNWWGRFKTGIQNNDPKYVKWFAGPGIIVALILLSQIPGSLEARSKTWMLEALAALWVLRFSMFAWGGILKTNNIVRMLMPLISLAIIGLWLVLR